ncbi:endonuclease domain-containing protein [Sinorhizobium fredii]|uniref:endonuclease domain-containing protein n=1 Tax=Rhizobium fredii TaxID=380 RepID=UPI00351531D7
MIEIDGATYHSSPEAVERDRIRDEFFVANGFRVLRIPAKVVFDNPSRAIEMVRAAVARGAPPRKVVTAPRPVSVTQTLVNAVKSVEEFVSYVDAHVTKSTAIEKAIGSSKQTFETEKTVIDAAMEWAKMTVDIEAELSANPNLRKHYADLEEILNNEPSPKITISPIAMPPSHPDSDINAAISLAYSNLMDERSRYFIQIRNQIKSNPSLAQHVQSRLQELGCFSSWREIESHG